MGDAEHLAVRAQHPLVIGLGRRRRRYVDLGCAGMPRARSGEAELAHVGSVRIGDREPGRGLSRLRVVLVAPDRPFRAPVIRLRVARDRERDPGPVGRPVRVDPPGDHLREVRTVGREGVDRGAAPAFVVAHPERDAVARGRPLEAPRAADQRSLVRQDLVRVAAVGADHPHVVLAFPAVDVRDLRPVGREGRVGDDPLDRRKREVDRATAVGIDDVQPQPLGLHALEPEDDARPVGEIAAPAKYIGSSFRGVSVPSALRTERNCSGNGWSPSVRISSSSVPSLDQPMGVASSSSGTSVETTSSATPSPSWVSAGPFGSTAHTPGPYPLSVPSLTYRIQTATGAKTPAPRTILDGRDRRVPDRRDAGEGPHRDGRGGEHRGRAGRGRPPAPPSHRRRRVHLGRADRVRSALQHLADVVLVDYGASLRGSGGASASHERRGSHGSRGAVQDRPAACTSVRSS